MNELAIQFAVGKQLRKEIDARVASVKSRNPRVFHQNVVRNAIKAHAAEGEDKIIVQMVEDLIGGGHFTAQDKNALHAMRPEALKSLHAKYQTSVDADVTPVEGLYTVADAMLAKGKITPERHKQMKAQEQERAERSARANARRRRTVQPTVNEADAEKYAVMVPPSAREALKAKTAVRRGQ